MCAKFAKASLVFEGTTKPDQGRVAIGAIKWTASKLKPKKYGEYARAR